MNGIDKLCDWNDNTSICSFNVKIATNIYSTLILTLIITVIAVPLDTFIDYLLIHLKLFIEIYWKYLNNNQILNDFNISNKNEFQSIKSFETEAFGSNAIESLESFRGMMIRAAKLIVMQSIDSLSVENELQTIIESQKDLNKYITHIPFEMINKINLIKDKNDIIKLSNGFMDYGDAVITYAELNLHKTIQFNQNNSNNLIMYEKLLLVRNNSNKLEIILQSLANDDLRNIYLIQSFLIDCLSGKCVCQSINHSNNYFI